MQQKLKQLLSVYRFAKKEDEEVREGEMIVVSDIVSKAASVYENLRNTLEYSDVHLVRRNAVRRILSRRLTGEMDLSKVSEELLQELIWGRYLPNNEVPVSRKGQVTKVLNKYQSLFEAAERDPRNYKKLVNWILDLVSTEIEYLLVPPRREEALVSFAYSIILDRIVWDEKLEIKEEEKDMQLFISVHRSLLKSNRSTLRYRTLTLFYPEWSKGDKEIEHQISSNLMAVFEAVEHHVDHPVGGTLSRKIRRKVAYFKVLHDIMLEHADKFDDLIEDTSKFRTEIEKAAKARYKSFRSRLGRSVLRAVVFLFFTKLILAFIIELPYDLLILKNDNYFPLAVNILFHPFFLAVLGFTVTIPEKRNTKQLVEGINSLIGEGEELEIRIKVKKKTTLGLVFNILYAITFLISYGLIVSLLIALGFNVISIILFLLFFSLVAFFGISIRYSRHELVVVKGRGGAIFAIADFFTLPIVRAGRWISLRAPRINIFLFFLDFIIEAPFKTAIAVIEGWLAFMKEKKEELE